MPDEGPSLWLGAPCKGPTLRPSARPCSGLLSEFGHVLPLKADTVRRQAGLLLEELPGSTRSAQNLGLDEHCQLRQ